MKESIQMIHRLTVKGRKEPSPFSLEKAREVRAFHQSFPEYAPTPLIHLKDLAALLGVSGLYVKDESKRFGLNAFKGLGGSYGIGRCLGEELGIPAEDLRFDALTSESVREQLGDRTFVTATDGNHGRGVAWAASRLGFQSVVYMPRGSSPERLKNIRAQGAEAFITDFGYDDAVRFASRQAEKNGWLLVQDTAWEGYEEIPARIMEGYTTMALEAVEQLGNVRPTHIFLQAGVGAMAGALAGFFADYYGSDLPVISVVEPSAADCIFRTAKAADGALHVAEGPLDTIMAGLACGEPCTIGWEMLDAYARNFFSVPDDVAAEGMRILGNPAGEDARIVSGESGAVTVGLAGAVLRRRELSGIREKLGLDQNSRILCFSTEGDTDSQNYRRIVWDGACSSL
ncbi:MAG: diaminopropionate ammonia-lyase [Clostridia bacterium]